MSESKNAPKKAIAILSCVVDHLYEDGHVHDRHMEEFLKAIPEALGLPNMEVPRTGDTILMSKSQFVAAENIALKAIFKEAAEAEGKIFNDYKLAPGGSLANTIATIAHSKKDGEPIVDTTILTVLDEGEAGDVFKQSYPDGVVLEEVVEGECLKVHVVPYDGDRSQFPTYCDTNPTNKGLSPYIAKHIAKGEYDEVYFEGFLADSPNFDSDSKTLIWSVGVGNVERERLFDKPPTRMIITAGAQHVCNNPAFREFVKEATKYAPVSIHANTGEFRRLMDNDEKWRETAEADFRAQGLQGRDLEKAKKASAEYRAAKVQANIDSVQKAINEWGAEAKHDLEIVVTDGGNTGYIINNDSYFTFEPDKLDMSTVVNKVGAGDAFMAYYRLARDLGLSQQDSVKAGGMGATYTMQQEEARPQMPARPSAWYGYSGPVGLLAKNQLIAPTQAAEGQRFEPDAPV